VSAWRWYWAGIAAAGAVALWWCAISLSNIDRKAGYLPHLQDIRDEIRSLK